MSELKNLSLAIGYCPATPMTVGDLDRFTRAAARLLPALSPRSISCWSDEGDRALSRRNVIRAALFENHRQHLDALLVVHSPDAMSAEAVGRLADALATLPAGGCAATSDLVLVSTGWLRRMAEASAPAQWFAVSNGCGPDRAFLTYLRGLGCPVVEFATEPAAAAAPESLQLPRGVHFLPAMGGASTVLPIGELSARIASAFSTINALPCDAAIAIYGAGVNGRALLPLLGDRVKVVIDRNPDLRGGHMGGVPVVTPEDLQPYLDSISTVLVTVIGREAEIRATLAEHLGAAVAHVRILDLQGRASEPVATAASPGGPMLPMATTPPIPNVTTAFEAPTDIPKASILAGELPKTTDRTITRRAVLYVGYPCNLKCKFCYYAYNEDNTWHSIEECTRDADLYRHEYGNDQVDITGGEPTIYPKIHDLVEHCATIGLRPSIITNMQVLKDIEKVRRFKDSGLYDFLCSIHGLGEAYNLITGTRKGWQSIVKAVGNLNTVGIRWRANCTATNTTMRQLKSVAQFAYEHGARVINFINYNPFYEWASMLEVDFQARHSEIQPYLLAALDYCDSVGLEANVRYTPHCQLPGHESKSYNYAQLSYDHHEWDYCSWYDEATRNPSHKMPKWMTRLADDRADLHLFLAQHTRAGGFTSCDTCAGCAMQPICDGPTNQYARRYGTGEMKAYPGPLVTDPTHFIRQQNKIVDAF
jgi:MoaA/NifB/PqqE/SkfB family radical SAM enzyme